MRATATALALAMLPATSLAGQIDQLCSLEGKAIALVYQMRANGMELPDALALEADSLQRESIMAAYRAPMPSLPEVQSMVLQDLKTEVQLACYDRHK